MCSISPDQPEYSNFPLADRINDVYVIYDSSLAGSTTTTLTNAEHAAAMRGHRDFDMVKTITGGSKSEIYFREDYKEAGIPIVEPPFKEVSAGIDIVSSLIKTRRLYIFSDQARLIKEFEEYAYKLDADGSVIPMIEKKELYHGLDSIRYACAGLKTKNHYSSNSLLAMSGRSLLDAI